MAPKPNGGGDMKQKSLMGWFSKAPAGAQTKAASKPAPPQTPKLKKTPSSSSVLSGKAHEAQKDIRNKTSSDGFPSSDLRSSPGASRSAKDTPPTSDLMDVDMGSETDRKVSKIKTGAAKRKVVTDDSDEELAMSAYSSVPPSSEADFSSPAGVTSRLKKQRVSVYESDEEDEEANESFNKRLSRFKKPAPPKKKRSSSGFNSDSDFAPAASDEDILVPSSARDTSASGGRSEFESSAAEIDSDEESDVPKKKQAKASKASRPSLKHVQSSEGGRSGGSASFLTAAEQRAKDKKNEKQATDDPFDFLKDVRDKDKNRPGDPGYDPRTLYVPSSAWKSFTPFEKQFWEIKQNHYDTVLFFQKGKFLELYEDDARIGHREFDLKLTDRVKMCMVGVPEQSFNMWASKFLAKGYKVGRVDQAETALGAEMRVAANKTGKVKKEAGDKIVRRELNKVYTNGTLVDAELILDEQAGHCVSIREEDPESDKGSFGVCVLDSSTSEFNMSTFNDDACCTKLETLMRQLRPKEILYTKGNLGVSTMRLLKVVLPESCIWTGLRDVEGFDYKQTITTLKKMYPSEDDDMEEGMGIPEAIRDMFTSKPAVEALGAMIWYLRQLNIDKDILSMKNFNIYDPMRRGQGLVLDGQTLAHIEVLQNNEGTEEGSLLKILQRCITPFGKRLFRIWLCMPLKDVSAINARLDAVQDLIDHPTFENDFTQLMKGVPDLERITSRIHAKNCKVRDFLKVLSCFRKLSKGLESLADIAETFSTKEVSGLLRSAPSLEQNVKHVESMFTKSDEDDELIPEKGKDEAYDEIKREIRELERELDSHLEKLESKSGLKLKYWHSALGTKDIYLVETKAGEKRVPKNWTKHGGTKAVARWNVPDIAPLIRQLKEARENRNTAMKNFKLRVFAEFDRDRDIWLRAVRTVAELDCLFSLAKSSMAIGEPACRPEFVEGDGRNASLDFEELRHPALCLKAENFIPNDVKLGGDAQRVALLTGPNMGGKSTAMRMTAVGVIMAQLGMLVPAKRACISPVDAILTRMGAYDNMFSNASTFKVELDECCKILRNATPRSLVILDELGRGTSTYDGMAIAGAVLHQLATHTLPLCFFATHYGSLTDDYSYHPNIRSMHMSTMVDDEKCELVFLYKLIDGIAESSFGTHVAALAGVPSSVVSRAATISADFAAQFKRRIEGKREKEARIPLDAQADFAFLMKLAKSLSEKDTESEEARGMRREVLKGLVRAVPRYTQSAA